MKVEVRSMKYYILMKCIGYLTLFSSEAKYDDASQVIRAGGYADGILHWMEIYRKGDE